MHQESVHLNLSKLALSFILFVGAAGYLVFYLVTGDWLWFVRGGFTEKPSYVIVYHDGQKDEFWPGQPGYDELTKAIQDTLNQGFARQTGIGLSKASIQDSYTKYVSIEAFFNHPVRVHAWFYTGNPTQMLFLITGRHSEENTVLMGLNGNYLSNAPSLKTVDPLHKVLDYLNLYKPATKNTGAKLALNRVAGLETR